MRFIYIFLLYLSAPYLFFKLWWRGRKEPSYRNRVSERLGFYSFQLQNAIWIHAVSVGETIAAIPLIKSLQIKFPNQPILVTTMTPTGAERVKAAFKEEVYHVYLPYDFPDAVKRFLAQMNPCIGIIMETELWPNLINALYERDIPICLLNARLSEKSATGYRRILMLTSQMLKKLQVIAAHGEKDADRFISLGAEQDAVVVTGNLKFDIQVKDEIKLEGQLLREQLGKEKIIWIAASTHEGEEEIIIKAHQQIQQQIPNALLILVPRHPNRFDEIAQLLHDENILFVRRSNNEFTSKMSVYLADTMGEMLLLYAAADIAFVGGSLIPRGGHNILEPAALKKPILTGPHLFNFAEISQKFFDSDAMIQVNDLDSIVNSITQLMKNKNQRDALSERAYQVVQKNRGALTKQLAIAEQLITKRFT